MLLFLCRATNHPKKEEYERIYSELYDGLCICDG